MYSYTVNKSSLVPLKFLYIRVIVKSVVTDI